MGGGLIERGLIESFGSEGRGLLVRGGVIEGGLNTVVFTRNISQKRIDIILYHPCRYNS